jgi:hypothetical protein
VSPSSSLLVVLVADCLCRGLWKEEARMSSTLGHAATELKEAERAVSSTMDKVSAML